MAKDIRDNVEYIDGVEVSAYVGRMPGSFDIDAHIGQTFYRGDLHTFLVTVRHESRQEGPNKGLPGTVKLTETLKIQDATYIDRDKAIFMLDNLGVNIIGVNDMPELSRSERDTEVEVEEANLFDADDFVDAEDLVSDVVEPNEHINFSSLLIRS